MIYFRTRDNFATQTSTHTNVTGYKNSIRLVVDVVVDRSGGNHLSDHHSFQPSFKRLQRNVHEIVPDASDLARYRVAFVAQKMLSAVLVGNAPIEGCER